MEALYTEPAVDTHSSKTCLFLAFCFLYLTHVWRDTKTLWPHSGLRWWNKHMHEGESANRFRYMFPLWHHKGPLFKPMCFNTDFLKSGASEKEGQAHHWQASDTNREKTIVRYFFYIGPLKKCTSRTPQVQPTVKRSTQALSMLHFSNVGQLSSSNWVTKCLYVCACACILHWEHCSLRI